MDSAVKRFHSEFAIFGIIVSILAIIGIFGYGKYLEYTLSDSIINSVKDVTGKEIDEISKIVTKKADSELNMLNQRFDEIESKLEKTRKRAEKIDLELEVNLESTLKRVEYIGRLMLEDVENHRKEIISGVKNESKKFNESRKKAEGESREILNKIKTEIENLEKLTVVVRAPLRKKISILGTLSFDKSSADIDIQRYMAILILKEMEDAELVKRENVLEEAHQVISGLLTKEDLHDGFFAEVRLRIIRAIAELRFVDIASKRILDTNSWDRGNLILLLGALMDFKAIPSLSKIIKNNKEAAGYREKAIKSLIYIRKSVSRVSLLEKTPGVIISHKFYFPHMEKEAGIIGFEPIFPALEAFWTDYHEFRDSEIEAMIPKSIRISQFRTDISHGSFSNKLYDIGVEALNYVLSNKKDDIFFRKKALYALKYFTHEKKDIEAIKDVLLNEWEDFAYDAIEVLAMNPDETVISILRDFVLNSKVDKSHRLKGVIALAKIGKPSALSALKEISKKDPNDVICKASIMAVNKFDERAEWASGFNCWIVTKGWLGIGSQTVNAELKEELGLKNEIGVLVTEVFPEEPADKAGFETGDVIVVFDGKNIKGWEDLKYTVATTPVGKKVAVTVLRKGKSKKLIVEIGKRVLE